MTPDNEQSRVEAIFRDEFNRVLDNVGSKEVRMYHNHKGNTMIVVWLISPGTADHMRPVYSIEIKEVQADRHEFKMYNIEQKNNEFEEVMNLDDFTAETAERLLLELTH